MSLIKQIFEKYFPKEITEIKKDSFNKGYASAKEEERNSRKSISDFEDEHLLFKPVIYKSNEWEELVVGELSNIEYNERGSPVYEIQDYISNSKKYMLCRPMPYSHQRLEIIGKLNPDEFCALFYEGKYRFNEFRKHPDYGVEGRDTFTNIENWKAKLQENGFYDKFKDFLEKEDEEAREEWGEKVKMYGVGRRNLNKMKK